MSSYTNYFIAYKVKDKQSEQQMILKERSRKKVINVVITAINTGILPENTLSARVYQSEEAYNRNEKPVCTYDAKKALEKKALGPGLEIVRNMLPDNKGLEALFRK